MITAESVDKFESSGEVEYTDVLFNLTGPNTPTTVKSDVNLVQQILASVNSSGASNIGNSTLKSGKMKEGLSLNSMVD